MGYWRCATERGASEIACVNFSHDFFSAGTRIRKVHICSGIYSSNVQTWKRVELDAADGTPWCCPSPCFKASTHVDVDAELQEVAGAEDGHRRGRPLPPQANSVKEPEANSDSDQGKIQKRIWVKLSNTKLVVLKLVPLSSFVRFLRSGETY